jgi:hypothetical protein
MNKTYKIDTDTITDEEEMLRFLMMEEVVFINNGWWNEAWPKDRITVHVNCNDIFAWGCADAEDLTYSDISELFRMYKQDPNLGAAAFCIQKRKQMPQEPVVELFRKDGIWNLDELVATNV